MPEGPNKRPRVDCLASDGVCRALEDLAKTLQKRWRPVFHTIVRSSLRRGDLVGRGDRERNLENV